MREPLKRGTEVLDAPFVGQLGPREDSLPLTLAVRDGSHGLRVGEGTPNPLQLAESVGD